jgi:hypothetical protein
VRDVGEREERVSECDGKSCSREEHIGDGYTSIEGDTNASERACVCARMSSVRVLCALSRTFASVRAVRRQEMFEISSCYFPITFNAPPNDPFGITGADLKVTLIT